MINTSTPEDSDSITALLAELSRGNREAEARLIPQVYDELRRVAARYMQNERRNHTLQPTALVNEAYVRLVQQHDVPWQGRAHFFAVAAQVMRHVLVDHARGRRAGKRGGAQHQITLGEDALVEQSRPIDVIALHEAMDRLSLIDARQARIVELRAFGGLSMEDIAQVLGVSDRTVKRDWKMARAWLHGELTKENDAARPGTA
jgi:RNA polymerase sigma-70 factor (ECF subfamily)